MAFKTTWNNHGVRTEHRKTHNQLFAEGAARLRHSGMLAVYFFDRVDELYGNDPEDYVVPPTSDDIVVQLNTFTHTDDQVEELKTNCSAC